jgi:RND superfamily putative drug exporter
MTAVQERERTEGNDPRPRRSVWRWLAPLLVIVAWLALQMGFGSLAGKTAEVQTNDNASVLPVSAESTEVQRLLEQFDATGAITGVVVYSRAGGLTAADRTEIQSDVGEFTSRLGDELGGAPAGPFFSEDGVAAQVLLQFRAVDIADIGDPAEAAREVAGDTDGLESHLTGQAGLTADVATAFAGIDGVLVVVTGAVVLIILVLVYRSPLLPVLVLISAGLALTVANGVIYLLAKNDLVTLNGQSSGILNVLVLGAATDYALLLVSRYREELYRQESKYDAIRTAWRSALPPIVASGGTVIVALLCLLLSDLKSNQGLGPVGAIGIAAAVLVMLTLMPAILALLGRAAFWPFRPKHGNLPAQESSRWSKVSALVGRRYRLIWVLSILGLLIMSTGMVRLNPNGVPIDEGFTTEQDSVTGQEILGRHFPGGTGTPTIVLARAGQLDAVVNAAKQVPGVAAAAPFTGAPAADAGTPAAPVVTDGWARIDVTLTDAPDSAAAYRTIDRLRSGVHAVPAAEAKVGGVTAINADVQDTSKRDRTLIIPLVLLVVFLILALLLRAVIMPLMLIGTVVLSYFAALGVSGVVFRDVFGFVGTDAAFPLFAFVFLVALGVDYNIFLMSRVREEVAGRGHRGGTLTGLTVTGGVITSAGIVLAATFSALSVVPVVFLVQLAFTVAFGVLLDTLIVRSLLAPALSLELGRNAWWPSKLRHSKP